MAHRDTSVRSAIWSRPGAWRTSINAPSHVEHHAAVSGGGRPSKPSVRNWDGRVRQNTRSPACACCPSAVPAHQPRVPPSTARSPASQLRPRNTATALAPRFHLRARCRARSRLDHEAKAASSGRTQIGGDSGRRRGWLLAAHGARRGRHRRTLREHRKVTDTLVAKHGGRLVLVHGTPSKVVPLRA
jgi:hypothetical protein